MTDPRAAYEFYADWDGDGFLCRDAAPTDALNIVPTPLTWANINNSAAMGGTVSKQSLLTRYGQKVLRVTTDASTNDGGYFGRSSGAVVDDIPVTAQAYTMSFWIRGTLNHSGVTMEVQVRDQAGNAVATFGTFTLTGFWTRYDLTFTPGGGVTYIFLDTHKFGSTALVTYEVSGIMLVAGSTAPAGFNVGHATNGYDTITDEVMAARWSLGMRAAYQLMSDESRLELTLTNESKRYSPDYASSALYGYMLPLRRIEIEGDAVVLDGNDIVLDGDDLVVDGTASMYVGYCDTFRPEMGQYSGPYTCKIEATNAKRFMEDKLDLPLQLAVTTDEVLTTLFTTYVQTPAGLDVANLYNFDAGLLTYDYVGDNWDPFTTAWAAAESLVQAERGKFFFARDGRATFFNSQHFEIDVTPVTTLTNTMAGMQYSFGKDIINECHVKFYPRKTNASQRLWESDSDITIAAGDSQEIRARFAAADGQQVGGDDVVTPSTGAGSLVFSAGSATLSDFVAEAQGATFTLTNDSDTTECVVSTLYILGTKITSWNAMESTRKNQASITAYGRRIQTIDARLLDTLTRARDRAAYEVNQKKTPRGVVESVTLKLKDGTNHGEMLAREIGMRLTVVEAQTAANQAAYIIGENHDWRAGGKEYSVRWALEPASIFDGWLLGVAGRSELGETTILGLL